MNKKDLINKKKKEISRLRMDLDAEQLCGCEIKDYDKYNRFNAGLSFVVLVLVLVMLAAVGLYTYYQDMVEKMGANCITFFSDQSVRGAADICKRILFGG